jgi:hypothetical protein
VRRVADMRAPGKLRRLASGGPTLALLALGLGCLESQPSSEVPFTHDFSDCEKWLEEETDLYAFSCQDGHYHFVAKATRRSDSSVTALSEAADRIRISVDAAFKDSDGLDAVGLGCWQGRDVSSPGYRFVVGPAGWDIESELGDGTAESLPASESGLEPQVSGNGFALRVECVAGPSETTLRLFLNGTLLGTAHDDDQGVGGFDQVGMIVSASKAPVAVDFDNFHVEEAEPTP